MQKANSRLRKANGQFKKTNYFTRGYFDWMVLLTISAFIYSLGYTLNNPQWIAKAVEPPTGVVTEVIETAEPPIASDSATPTTAPIVTVESEKQAILKYIVDTFGDRSPDAIVMLRKCENGAFNQSAINHNRNGTTDHGIFQINSIHEPRYGSAFKTDWKANVDVAYEIYKSHGYKFTAWSCANWAGDKSYKD